MARRPVIMGRASLRHAGASQMDGVFGSDSSGDALADLTPMNTMHSASNMSKRSSPLSGRYLLPDTNLNPASGSMKRRINQALAMRSTYTPCRVTQVLLRSVLDVLVPESTVTSSSFNRASRFLIKPSAVSRPMALATLLATVRLFSLHRGDAAKAEQDDDFSGDESHGDPPLNATQRSDGVSEHSTIFSCGHQI
jgi:hypothetical protein